MDIRQYDIILVNLDPTIGSEIKKTRPCLVISPNEMNKYLRTVIVAPMTTADRTYPTRVVIHYNVKIEAAAIDQIRTIDKSRVIKSLGKISKAEIENCKAVIQETFVN
uniref:type II toxin-antitoxin system PemK/MazF family toxin n=1 Tax=Roseivirga sp. TaxID=1964215 RepID=UPI004048DF51